jgi:2-methylcitrate dehydratase PrpD
MPSSSVAAQSVRTLTGRLADYIAATAYAKIPQAAFDTAKLAMLDTFAVAWAGSDAPGCGEARALLVDEGTRNDATAWAFGDKLPAASAAFINGMSASALDYDSLARDAPVHLNIAVMPAAVARAERERASGKEFLAALVIGSDLMCRLSAASKLPPQGFHYVSLYGVFGAAAAAAKLLRLNASQIQHTLGIAFMQTGGSQQANIDPSLSKRMLSAFAARSGVFAAQLAARGITGPAQALEGELGLYNMFQKGDPVRLLDEIGTRFDSTRISLKQYPSCGCNHMTIDGMLKLVRQHDLQPDDVESIDVTVPPYTARLVGGKYDPSGDAQVAAQFSIRYSIACCLVRRRLGLAEIQADAARDPKILAHVPKVNVHVDATLPGTRGPIILRVKTHSKGELSSRVEIMPGSAEAPMSQAEVDDKFNECFGLGVRPLNAAQIAEVKRRVYEIEKLDDMSKFFDGIC